MAASDLVDLSGLMDDAKCLALAGCGNSVLFGVEV
jgi:hypothetical protein